MREHVRNNLRDYTRDTWQAGHSSAKTFSAVGTGNTPGTTADNLKLNKQSHSTSKAQTG